jgi:hypothetical protein
LTAAGVGYAPRVADDKALDDQDPKHSPRTPRDDPDPRDADAQARRTDVSGEHAGDDLGGMGSEFVDVPPPRPPSDS